jgi:hypothetical protein
MPRFVILQHVAPPASERGTHYDLMLEQAGKLLTWAIVEQPRPGLHTTATQLPDHRLAYLDYEGPISGNRGAVTRVAAGEYVPGQLSEAAASFELRGPQGNWQVEMRHQAGDQWIAEFSAGA